MTRALILVDIQNDFLPDGALAVPEGDEVIPVANLLLPAFNVVVATQDWHPPNHKSFAVNHEGASVGDVIRLDGLDQILWPTHCVEGTHGAEFAESLEIGDRVQVFRKGTDPSIDSYSGFFDNGHRKSTGLDTFLRDQGVSQVYILGLATDYCVNFTALDAADLGFETYLIADGCRGVNLESSDVANAIQAMQQSNVRVIQSSDLLDSTSH